jgi:hypothetical protein|tara:strand:+ start:822 stop:1109 length:288 start_codon:yes stop_codon:yes gene_type:complete
MLLCSLNTDLERKNNMRDVIVNAMRSYFVGQINKHLANIEVYMNSTTGIGEHSDILETIELELEQVATYHDKLEMLTKFFITQEKIDADETTANK